MFSLSLCALVAVAPGAAGASSSLAVAPTQFSGDVGDLPTALFDDALLTAVQQEVGASVIGADDINAMIGFEETKELVGCDATNCIADIGGALGVERLMVMKVANLGEDWVVTSKIINITETKVNSRSSDFVAGGARQLLTALPAIVGKLFGGGGGVTPVTGATGGGGASTSSPAPTAPAAGPETDRAIAAMSASLRTKVAKIWPEGELEEAAPVPDTLVALATYRLRKSGASTDGQAYSEARTRCKRKKEAAACVEASDRLLTGHGINESAQQGGEYLLRACKLGDADSCTQMRAMVGAYFSGRSLYHRTSAEHLLVKMCLEEIPDSCEHLQDRGGAGVVDALSVACEQQNNASACATLVAKGAVWRVGRNTRTIGYVLLGGTLIFGALAGVEYALAGVSADNGDPIGEASSLAYALYFSVFAVVSFVGGLGFTGYGLYKVSHAKSRANAGVSRTVAVLPVIARQDETVYSGLGLLWSF